MPLSALVLATAAAASSPGTTIGRGTRGAHGAAMRNPVAVAQMRQSAMLQQMVPNAEMLEMVLAGSDAEPLPLRTNGSIVLLTPSLAEHRLSGTAQHRCMLTADVVRRFARTLRTRGGGCAGGGVWGALAERAQRWHDGSKAVAARLGRGATSALRVALHVLGAASVVCVAGAVVWRTGLLAGAQ